jgi:ABC-2 type transport system permease protein
VESFCDRAVLLEQGRIVDVGDPAAIARRYEQLNLDSTRVRAPGDRWDGGSHARAAATRRYRPSALGEGARRIASLTFTLAQVEFKLHYLGSALGYLWSVMRPLMLFAVTYFVFTRVGSFGAGVQSYGIYLLTSLVLWTFFAESTSGAAMSLLRSQSLLRKLRFPRITIPLSVVLKSLFNLGLNLVAVAVFVVTSGLEPRASWLELPLLLLLLTLLATGVAMLLSALFVRYRDVAQIWAVLLQVLFFGSAVLYVVTDFPKGLQREAIANPLAMIFTEMRHALIDPSAPSAADVAGGWPWLLVPLGVIAVVLALGFWVFKRESPQMAENL